MNHSLEVEVKVGVFVSLGVLLIALTILLLGGGSFFSSSVTYSARFSAVEGLMVGGSVKLMGVRVGKIERIHMENNPSRVLVEFNVAKEYTGSIHEDSTVSVQTMGVLGDKFLVISPGTSGVPVAQLGVELKTELPKDLKDYLGSADAIMERLKSTLAHVDNILGNFDRDSRSEIFFRNLAAVSSNMNAATSKMPVKMNDFYDSITKMSSVMSKIDRGEGTIGALINDPTLYDDLKTLLGGANRNKVLKYFVRKSVEDSRDEAKKAEAAAEKNTSKQ